MAVTTLTIVYHQMGKNEQAVILYEDVLEIQDTLKSRKARNTALELAAIYHDNEQHQIIMQQEAENTRNSFVIILVVQHRLFFPTFVPENRCLQSVCSNGFNDLTKVD